jgi:DNA polymerase-3 subunit alpha
MVDDFINRRHGRAKVEYPHPAIEPVLKQTYGVILYQEQVMQIAQVLAGYTLGSADSLRRAMGKKKPEEMAKQRAVFVEGACQRGVDRPVAEHIFDLMEKFAGYGFNKSHSAAYALLSYQTAWLKANYPAEYMAAVLSADMDNTDKVVRLIEDCKMMHLKIWPPTINKSAYRFTVDAEGAIIYGLGAIKGVGEAALENCLQNRDEQGPFENLFDLCNRIDARKVNRRVLESLIKAGALDSFQKGRATLLASLDKALMFAEQNQRNEELGQTDLFGEASLQTKSSVECEYLEMTEWEDEVRLLGEKETLGLYLTGHPINQYEAELAQIISAKLADLKPAKEKTVTIAGLVVAARTVFTKNGNRMAVATLDDRSARIELVIFSDLFAACKEILEKDKLLIAEGEVSLDEYTEGLRMTGRKILTIDQARESAKKITLSLQATHFDGSFLNQLKGLLETARGGTCSVHFNYSNGIGSALLAVGANYRVRLTENLLDKLRLLCGKEAVAICY